MLKVRNLNFGYNGTKILKDISFQVGDGHLCGLFGPNGCGKTTLFKCCLNFLKFREGEVVMDGVDIKHTRVEEMAKLVAYVPQEHKPPFPYSVKEVVLMGRTPHLGGVFGICHEDKKKALDALKLLGILDIADKPYNHQSGGQRQLVLIARAVAQETKLLFLDEPTSALDFKNQIKIWRILEKISEKGTTILACTHDPNHVLWFCDKVIVLGEEGVIANGTPRDSITKETLERIYGNVCDVRGVDNVNMVMPNVA
jgi:iron complex transport system ATP-binding protein